MFKTLCCQHAEPSLDEFLPVETPLELENRQLEEEDAMYRKFLQVPRIKQCNECNIDGRIV